MKHAAYKITLLLLFAMLCGCVSDRVSLTPPPTDNYQRLGKVDGSACGHLGILGTAYYFIPMALNSRYERAYSEALAKAPGATGLIDVTISEDWFWWVIGTARCVNIKAEAIK